MKAPRHHHRHQMNLILKMICRQKSKTTIIMIYLMVANHVHDMRNQREWRNENENLVRMHMNDNLNMAKRRMIERNLKGVVHEFIISGKRLEWFLLHSAGFKRGTLG
jgi:hypothetical protein